MTETKHVCVYYNIMGSIPTPPNQHVSFWQVATGYGKRGEIPVFNNHKKIRKINLFCDS